MSDVYCDMANVSHNRSERIVSEDTENIEDHIARKCECGSVNFNLLKSGEIECAGECQKRFGHWSELKSGVYHCASCTQRASINVTPECRCGENKWTPSP